MKHKHSTVNKSTIDRLVLAAGQDHSIIYKHTEVSTATGHPEGYLQDLGMTHGDLLRLERAGMAIRARTQNIFWPNLAEEPEKFYPESLYIEKVKYTDERGYDRYRKEIRSIQLPRVTNRAHGSRTRWIIVLPTTPKVVG